VTARIPLRPGEVIDRTQPIGFSWDGRSVCGFAGDTVASALLATGTRTLARSFKYHQPLGVLSGDLYDPHCRVSVNGVPNLPGAHLRLEAGMVVRSQGAWPSVDRDVKAVNGLLRSFLVPGFYYKTFMAPHALLPLYRHALRRFSAGGKALVPARPPAAEKRYVFHDVVIAGGGPAGIAASLAAARAGASVLLVEQEYEVGGSLRWGGAADLVLLAELRDALAAEAGVEVLVNSTVFGRYDDGWLGIRHGGRTLGEPERLLRGRPGALVVACGLVERPSLFHGNALPGTLLPTAVRRLVNLHAVRPGSRAVVLCHDDESVAAAADLEAAGAEVVRIEVSHGDPAVARARGRREVEAVWLTDGRRFDADLLVAAAGWTVPAALPSMAGGRVALSSHTRRFAIDELPGRVVLAGGIAGAGSVGDFVAHAAAVGEHAAHLAAPDRIAYAAAPAALPPGIDHDRLPSPLPRDAVVDFDEDVAAGELLIALDEGYDSIELVKRYTTVTMGSTQGKHSLVNAIAVVAAARGQSLEQVGTTTWRPPFTPVSLGMLAGPQRHPIRRTPLHAWHDAHGARFFAEGEWLRPESYGDPAGEARAVRESVGVIDVSTLGKIDVRGDDASRLLDYLYINSWASLAEGRARYGVMCDDAGIVVEDGVVGRLDENRFLLTTTSSGAQRTWRRIERIQQETFPESDLYAALVTDCYASMNVTGPRSRELLEPLIEECDLERDAFPFMHVRTARIAGVDGCFLWRIGFTGELSFELHVPAHAGLDVWHAILSAGERFGIRPFGVEAQRILRVEKGHFVVGQDTDSETTPFELGLARMVGQDKGEFVGRIELEHRRDREPSRRLVGLQHRTFLPESALVVSDGRSVGRVTSSKMSPTLERCVSLALLETAAADRDSVTVRLPDGSDAEADVVHGVCHVDPEGARARG